MPCNNAIIIHQRLCIWCCMSYGERMSWMRRFFAVTECTWDVQSITSWHPEVALCSGGWPTMKLMDPNNPSTNWAHGRFLVLPLGFGNAHMYIVQSVAFVAAPLIQATRHHLSSSGRWWQLQRQPQRLTPKAMACQRRLTSTPRRLVGRENLIWGWTTGYLGRELGRSRSTTNLWNSTIHLAIFLMLEHMHHRARFPHEGLQK